jgi:hypothetical protein
MGSTEHTTPAVNANKVRAPGWMGVARDRTQSKADMTASPRQASIAVKNRIAGKDSQILTSQLTSHLRKMPSRHDVQVPRAHAGANTKPATVTRATLCVASPANGPPVRVNVGNDRRAVGGRSPPIDRPCRLTCYAAAAFVSRAARRSVDLLRPRVSLATPYIRACSEWRPASSRSGQGARCATDLHPARGRDQRWSSDLGGRTLLELQRPRARRKAQRRITNAAGERNQTNTVGITRCLQHPITRNPACAAYRG